MASKAASKTSRPADICGYAVDCALAGDESYFVVGPGGRGVVLKALDPDCLLPKGTLHPSIKDRLSRVRELALTGVANLYGVERDREQSETAWLVWEYVRGVTLDQFAAETDSTPRRLALAARELILTVDSLHMQGIIHGGLKGANVIVAAGGTVRLTHVSPLLWTDPAVDARAVIDLLLAIVRRRKEEGTALGRLLNEASAAEALDGRISLRPLGANLAALIESREAPGGGASRPRHRAAETHPRRRALLGAALVIALGFAAAFGVWRALGQPAIPLPKALHDLRGRMEAGW